MNRTISRFFVTCIALTFAIGIGAVSYLLSRFHISEAFEFAVVLFIWGLFWWKIINSVVGGFEK